MVDCLACSSGANSVLSSVHKVLRLSQPWNTRYQMVSLGEDMWWGTEFVSLIYNALSAFDVL